MYRYLSVFVCFLLLQIAVVAEFSPIQHLERGWRESASLCVCSVLCRMIHIGIIAITPASAEVFTDPNTDTLKHKNTKTPEETRRHRHKTQTQIQRTKNSHDLNTLAFHEFSRRLGEAAREYLNDRRRFRPPCARTACWR